MGNQLEANGTVVRADGPSALLMKAVEAGFLLASALLLAGRLSSAELENAPASKPPRAARSVHLRFKAPAATVFYNEVTVEESTSSTYFCVCGFNHGYFGLQELRPGREKVLIFSVWDPGQQDDPASVDPAKRVELLHQGEGVRVGRFGGEGTGGQSFLNYPWKKGETYRFMVSAVTNGTRTSFAAWFYMNESREWRHLATFRTITGGKSLGGYYSFIEDFRRDGKSVNERRRARFGHGWVRTVAGSWLPLTNATFTGDSTPLFNIDAGTSGRDFFLATGGGITIRSHCAPS